MKRVAEILLIFFASISFPSQMEAFSIRSVPLRPPVFMNERKRSQAVDGLDDRIRGSQSPKKKRRKCAAAAAAVFCASFSQTAKAASSLGPIDPSIIGSIPLPWTELFALSSSMLLLQKFGAAFLQLSILGTQQFSAWYMAQLTLNPIITKSVTAAVIGFFGDFGAQWLEHCRNCRSNMRYCLQKEQEIHANCPRILEVYDYRRGLSIALDGLLISGPLMHAGYEVFESLLPVDRLTGTFRSLAAVAHVVADSLVLDSIFVATTFLVTGIMEGYPLWKLIPQFRKDYFPAVKAGLATSSLLMPLEFACFRFLPLTLRVLAVNFIDVIWDAVISFMAHRGRKELAEASEETPSAFSDLCDSHPRPQPHVVLGTAM